MKRVIVHADDFGSSIHFNNAIIKAYKRGFLTSTAIVANGKAFEEGLLQIKKECPSIGLGVHLNLVEGRSKLRPDKRYFNIYKDGVFDLSFIKILFYSFNKNFLNQIELEFRNQIESVQEHIEIDHLNSHQHCASVPQVFDICCRLAKEYGIKNVRVPNEKVVFTSNKSKFFSPKLLLNLVKLTVLKVFTFFNRISLKKYGLNSTDHFCGVLYTGFMDSSVIVQAIKKLQSGKSIEILLHPCDFSGDCSGEYLENSRDYAVDYHRIDELKVLLDEKTMNFVESHSSLISYKEFSLNSKHYKKISEKINHEDKKLISVFIIFDETTFFHPTLLHKLINEVELVNWVGALRVNLPRGGALQSYMLSKWKQLGLKSLLGLVIKTLIFKCVGILPQFITGGFFASVEKTLKINDISYRTINKIDDVALDFIRSKNPDVILSSNSLIFPKELLNIPNICSINRHSSPLPSYGGILPVFRSIQFKEKYCGASVHIMEEGIDTGRVLSRKFLPIQANDTIFKLYEMLFVLSFVAILEALEKVRKNLHHDETENIEGLKQSYFSFPNDEDWQEFNKNGGRFI